MGYRYLVNLFVSSPNLFIFFHFPTCIPQTMLTSHETIDQITPFNAVCVDSLVMLNFTLLLTGRPRKHTVCQRPFTEKMVVTLSGAKNSMI